MTTKSERRRNREAARRMRRDIPRRETRSLLAFGMRSLDAIWSAGPAPPMGVLVIERGALALAKVAPVEEMLAALGPLAPVVRAFAAKVERARLLANADAIGVALPEVGVPEGAIFARPGRYLGDEDLGALLSFAMSEQPLSAGGDA